MAELILDALNHVDDSYILDAEKALDLVSSRPVLSVKRRKTFRAVLVAAVIAALLLTACATAIWGIERKLTPARDPYVSNTASDNTQNASNGGYLSRYGAGDTPEAMAMAEWLDFCYAYTAEVGDGKLFDEDKERDLSWLVYGSYNDTMQTKLYEISEKYKLKLHSSFTQAWGVEDLYEIIGTEPFLLFSSEDDMFISRMIFEDGSFLCDGQLTTPDMEPYFFVLLRCGPGYLPPFTTAYIKDPADYEQWRYTTSSGDEVVIAHQSIPNPVQFTDFAHIFYEENDWSITMNLSFTNYIGRESAQSAADCFDFSALCHGEGDVESFISAGPTESSAGKAISTADFMATPEYMAAAEFDKAYRDYLLAHNGSEYYVPNFNTYFRGWPSGDPELDAIAEEICERHSLKPADSALYMNDRLIPVELLFEDGSMDAAVDYDSFEPVTTEQMYAYIGCEPFLSGSEPYALSVYDNGCFSMGFAMGGVFWGVDYIQKGSLFTALAKEPTPLSGPDIPSWAYDTAWGGSVTIAIDKGSRLAYIFYETDNAYIIINSSSVEPRILEAGVDCVDLSKLG